MMKKLFTLLMILLMCVSFHTANADEDYVVLEDYEDFMTSSQYIELNEDLRQIEKNYDIGIYFIYDTSIKDTDEGVGEYAENFIASHAYASNNVAIIMSNSYYYVAAKGSAEDAVLQKDEAIFDRFYSTASQLSNRNPDAFYEGIKAAYQYVVEIVNNQVYQSDAPVSVNKTLVNDFADLLSDTEEEKLNLKLQRIREKYGFDAVVVTTDSFNGMSGSDYADDFYDYSQYSEDGLVFILNMKERVWYVSTSGKAIDYFTDYGIDQIFEDMSDDIVQGKYYDAFTVYANRVEKYIVNGQKGDIIDVNNQKKTFSSVNVFISMLIGALSSLITSLSMKGKMKNVSRQHYAGNYIVSGSFNLNGASDMLVNRHVSRTPIQRNEPGRGSSGPGMGSGGSSIHTSSSGSSHGGHGGHF